jgi:hypothetical protein
MSLAEYQQRRGASVMRSARPHNAMARVYGGDATKALRQIKKQVDQPPSVRRKM